MREIEDCWCPDGKGGEWPCQKGEGQKCSDCCAGSEEIVDETNQRKGRSKSNAGHNSTGLGI